MGGNPERMAVELARQHCRSRPLDALREKIGADGICFDIWFEGW